MPKPSSTSPLTPKTASAPGISLRSSKKIADVSPTTPILAGGIIALMLKKFEPDIKEGKDFNNNFRIQAELVDPHPYANIEGEEAAPGYSVFHNEWLGDQSRDGKDLSDQRDRKLKQIISAFYTEEEQQEFDEDTDLLAKIQEKVGSEFHVELAIRPARTHEGTEYPESNTFKKYIPKE